MTIENCSQTSCSFNPDNDRVPNGKQKEVLKSCCPICPICKANQWIINTECNECLVCETIPDRIRGDGKGDIQGQDIQIKEQENVKPQDEPIKNIEIIHPLPIIRR